MRIFILISLFLCEITVCLHSVTAQNPLESSYIEWSYQRHMLRGVTRYMTFHNHRVSANVPYHQHLNYDPFLLSTEVFSYYQLEIQHYLNTRVLVQLQAPYVINKRLDKTVVSSIESGLGDLTFIGKYHLYNSKLYSNNTSSGQLLLLGAGLTLPTGTFDNFDENNEAEPHLKTGTASVNYLFSTDYLSTYGAWQTHLNMSYQLNTPNAYTFLYGNKTTIQLLISRHFDKKDCLFSPSFGLNFNYLQNDEMNEQTIVEDTKKQVLWAIISTQFRFKKIECYGNYQLKIFEKLEGIQPNNQYQLEIGVRYFLPKQKMITTVR